MVRCAVPGCGNDSRKQTKKRNDISFHRFPTNCDVANKWTKAIKRLNWEPNIRSFVCSVHFNASSSFQTKSGLRRRLVDGAVPDLYLESKSTNTSAPPKTPSTAGQRAPCVLEKEMSRIDAVNKDNNLQEDEEPLYEIKIISRKSESGVSDESHINKVLPLQGDLRCQVCNNDIIGFRYVCVQCAHWDMCAACEARGEHPAHYVLRLPAPKPYEECEPVIAAIREHIHNLLRLSEEIKSEVDIKEEIYIEETTEVFEPYMTYPLQATVGREVPELNIYLQNSTEVNIADVKQETTLSATTVECPSPTVNAPRVDDNQTHSGLSDLAKECISSKKWLIIRAKRKQELEQRTEGNHSDCH